MPAEGGRDPLATLAPALFVLLWSSGFVAAKGGLAGAEPFTFLALRFALAALVMLAVALARRSRWPRGRRELAPLAAAGLLMQVAYFGATYQAFAAGIGAGALALILALQPLVTACIAGPLLGERVAPRQWLGFLLGVAGVALVLSGELAAATGIGTGGGALWGFAALVAITAGTLGQKRLGPGFDLWSGGAVQYGLAALVVGALALLLETARVRWSPTFALALAYLVVMNSVVAVGLLTAMVRRGEAARVTSLMFLVPPGAALLAWLALGERLAAAQALGIAVAATGVALVMRRPAGERA
jgi:drug/metabolite transporter (DMT)-like permease